MGTGQAVQQFESTVWFAFILIVLILLVSVVAGVNALSKNLKEGEKKKVSKKGKK